jgi:hypothetical protein
LDHADAIDPLGESRILRAEVIDGVEMHAASLMET